MIQAHLGSLLNLSSDRLRNELLDELLELGSLGLSSHNLDHLGSDLTDLRRFGVSGLLDLVEGSLGETNSEKSENVTISGSDVDRSLDEGLPFSDNRSELVGGEVHTVERGQAVLALNGVSAAEGTEGGHRAEEKNVQRHPRPST